MFYAGKSESTVNGGQNPDPQNLIADPTESKH